MVERPLEDRRPVGPFINVREGVSEFDKIEVQTRDAEEDTIYKVSGIHLEGAAARSVGLVVETNALMINDDTIAAFEINPNTGRSRDLEDYMGSAGIEIIAEPDEKVGIAQADRNLTKIVIDP